MSDLGLRAPALLALCGFAITIPFALWPTPYLMAAFTFVAQPLFGIAALFYVRRVIQELRHRDVL